MVESESTSFVAECFWPGVTEADVEALDARALASASDLADGVVRYLGSILVSDDEVVLCQFEGTAETVREVAERAQIPFERLLETVRLCCGPRALPQTDLRAARAPGHRLRPQTERDDAV